MTGLTPTAVHDGPPLTGAGRSRASREQREFVSLMTSRVRDAYCASPSSSTARIDLVSVCRELARARPRPTRWCATASASASSPPPTCATRCSRPAPPSELPVRDVGALRALVGVGRRRAVRGAAADAAPPRPPRAGARGRRGRRRAQPARPDGLRRQPLAPRSRCRSSRPRPWPSSRRRRCRSTA